jgi:hypothetical protein
MLKIFASALALTATMMFFAGCHSSGDDSSSSSSTTQASATTEPAVPADSPFAKVRMGEERDEVFATIGQPTSMSNYQTGKAFIPFHYGGGDDMRMAAHYKGIGIITFANDSAYTSGYSVIDIHYDPSEAGY